MYGDNIAVHSERTFDDYMLMGYSVAAVHVVVVDVGVVALTVEGDEVVHVLLDDRPCTYDGAVHAFVLVLFTARCECQYAGYQRDGDE